MTDIVGGLVKRRAELSGEADAIRTRLAQIGTDLGHLDAVIRQFDPDHDVAAIRPKRARASDVAGRGERSREMFTVLRDAAEPITTAEVVRRMMARQGREADDKRIVAQTVKRVGTVLSRQKAKGAVRSELGREQCLLWHVAR